MFFADNSLLFTVLIMNIVAPIGAFDVLYYHIWKFRLYDRHESRWETVTHLVRELIFAVILVLLFNYRPQGAWFGLLVVLAVLDFANNAIDTFLESASRAALGGVPRNESVVHIVGATASGVISASLFIFGWNLFGEPTRLVPIADSAIPGWLALGVKPLIGVSFVALFFETGLFVRSIARKGWAA